MLLMTKIDKNEPMVSNKIIKCIAADCIMWRRKMSIRESYVQGYCGLASKPEE